MISHHQRPPCNHLDTGVLWLPTFAPNQAGVHFNLTLLIRYQNVYSVYEADQGGSDCSNLCSLRIVYRFLKSG